MDINYKELFEKSIIENMKLKDENILLKYKLLREKLSLPNTNKFVTKFIPFTS